jgi:tripartite-type tricarboxylate transporter receptor subunit TctC
MKALLKTAACVLLLACIGVNAQEYPARPVTVIVPFSAGSASDVIGRIVLERMGTSMGRRFVVENRPAAGGNVGTLAVAKAEPDGYTIVMSASGPLAANKALYPNLGYDPERDFQPISLYASLPNVIVVSTKLPVNTLAELTDYVRKNPKVPYGSVGNGSSQHLAGAFFEQIAGAQMTHVPYRVTAQLVSDLVAGQVPVSFQLLPNVIGQLRGGQLRALAVASDKRLPALPDVPTAAEAGVKGYNSAAWFAFLAPRGTPRPIVDRLYREIAAAMADPAVRSRFTEFGAEPLASTPEELGRHISAEIAKWREIITRAAITLDP